MSPVPSGSDPRSECAPTAGASTQDDAAALSYDDLRRREDGPPGSTWGFWGGEDELGTLNLATPERVTAAARLIRTGAVFPLQLPLNLPRRVAGSRRGNPVHRILRVGFETHGESATADDPEAGYIRDDYLERLYPQGSSQWDALCHVRHPVYGNYNGIGDNEITGEEGSRLGIDRLAARGLAGRGVLLDVQRHLSSQGRGFDPYSPYAITVQDLAETVQAQGTTIEAGDIIIIHTGFTDGLMAAPDKLVMGVPGSYQSAGLDSSEDMLAYLWSLHPAALASDALGVEVSVAQYGNVTWHLHTHWLSLWGMPLGEMWYLEDLAAACATDGDYAFFFSSCPLFIRGGVGSPPQALAIK